MALIVAVLTELLHTVQMQSKPCKHSCAWAPLTHPGQVALLVHLGCLSSYQAQECPQFSLNATSHVAAAITQ